MTDLISSLPYIQIILAIILMVAILLQQSENGSGSTFGGADNWNSGYHTRRGFEKVIFNSTIVLGILFALVCLLNVIL